MTKNPPLEIMARLENWSRFISISIGQFTDDESKCSIAKPLVFEQSSSVSMPEPAIRLEINEAQKLMDELWQCGLRPSEGTGSAGALAATEKHLQDMQRIVFKAYPK